VLNDRVHGWLKDRYPSAPIHRIGNGVDTTMFRPATPPEVRRLRGELGLPQERTLVLFVGRNAPMKNLNALLAMPRGEWELVLCGADRRQSPQGVMDLGILPHGRMADLYRCVDIVALPSSSEGFPVVAQEALASGLPLVILWDEGYRQSLDPDVVAACRTLGEFQQTLESLAASSAQRRSLALLGREWAVKHWSWERSIHAYECLYREIMDGHHGFAAASEHDTTRAT
jgi:glycosyltransferase involved in cell wall biosynthesis